MAGFRNEETRQEWMKRLEIMGYKSIKEYQDDIFKKYGYYYASEFPLEKISFYGRKAELKRIVDLIADLTEKKAEQEDMKKVVTYSAVLIDAEKHLLDWKRAKDDLGIMEIKRKYFSGRYKWG